MKILYQNAFSPCSLKFPYCAGVNDLFFSSPAKLKELNGGAPQEHKLSEEILESLERLLVSICEPNSSNAPPTIQQINLLWKASHWPEGTTQFMIFYYVFLVFHFIFMN